MRSARKNFRAGIVLPRPIPTISETTHSTSSMLLSFNQDFKAEGSVKAPSIDEFTNILSLLRHKPRAQPKTQPGVQPRVQLRALLWWTHYVINTVKLYAFVGDIDLVGQIPERIGLQIPQHLVEIFFLSHSFR